MGGGGIGVSVASGVAVGVAVGVFVAVGVNVGVNGLVGDAVMVGNAVGKLGSDKIGAGVAVSGIGSGADSSVGSIEGATAISSAGGCGPLQAMTTAIGNIKKTNFSLSTFLFLLHCT